MFKDVELHMSFPNLTLLNMIGGYDGKGPLQLPDLSGCEGLESVTLYSYWRKGLSLSFQCNLKEKVTDMKLHLIYSLIATFNGFYFHFTIDPGSLAPRPQEATYRGVLIFS